jgi:signal transduction histidine kinase
MLAYTNVYLSPVALSSSRRAALGMCGVIWAFIANGVGELLHMIKQSAEGDLIRVSNKRHRFWNPPWGEFAQLQRVGERSIVCVLVAIGLSTSVLQEFVAMSERVHSTAAKLRAALAAKDQFLRYIFHEMRVPLNAVHLAIDELNSESEEMEPQVQSLLDIAAFQVAPAH